MSLTLTVSTKIKLVSGLLVAVILIMGGFAINRLSTVNHQSTEITTNWLPSVVSILTIKDKASNIRLAEYRLIMADNKDKIDTEKSTINNISIEIKKEKEKYEHLISSNEERRIYEDFSREWDTYVAISSKISSLVDKQSHDEAVKVMLGESRQAYAEASAPLMRLVELNIKGGKDASLAGDEIYALSRTLMLVALMMAAIIGIGGAYMLVRSVSHPVDRMTKFMQDMASGQIDGAVPDTERKDEIGAMAKTVQVFQKGMQEARRLEQAAKDTEIRTAEEKRRTMNQLADEFHDGVGQVVQSVGAAVTQMQGSSQAMSATAEETSKQATAVAAASEQTSANVQTVAAATEELSASISEIGRQVGKSSDIARHAADEVQRTHNQIQNLAKTAEKIGAVVGLITDIANQTNLLALNATIEAARAGEAGKGFAVVANEVKSLANQTAKATGEIANQINAVQDETRQAVEAIDVIATVISDISSISTTVAAAVEEQAAAAGEIARNVEQASLATQEVTHNISGVTHAANDTGSAAGQVLQASHDLGAQSDALSNLVARFVERVRAA